jgi:hypothetical protein
MEARKGDSFEGNPLTMFHPLMAPQSKALPAPDQDDAPRPDPRFRTRCVLVFCVLWPAMWWQFIRRRNVPAHVNAVSLAWPLAATGALLYTPAPVATREATAELNTDASALIGVCFAMGTLANHMGAFNDDNRRTLAHVLAAGLALVVPTLPFREKDPMASRTLLVQRIVYNALVGTVAATALSIAPSPSPARE